jgi:hypothetical protein
MELYHVRLKLSQHLLHHRIIPQCQCLSRNIQPTAYTIDLFTVNFVDNILFAVIEAQYSDFVILAVVGDVFADVFHAANVGRVVFGDMEDTHIMEYYM